MLYDTSNAPAQLQYVIRQGNIASCIHVTVNGVEYTAIYMNDAPKVEAYRENNMRADRWHEFPIEVAAAVVRQFRAIFKLPVEQRDAYIETLAPITIHAAALELGAEAKQSISYVKAP